MKTIAILLSLFASFAIAAPQTVTTTADQTITGKKTFSGTSKLCLKEPSGTDVACLNAPALASSTVALTLPALDGTLATLAGTETLTNKSIDAGQLTGTLAAARMPALTGDVTTSAGAVATTIANNAVTLAKMAQIATTNMLGRSTASTGNVESLTPTQSTALLNAMVGDSGSGGTKGLVPAPAAGDAAASKFLKADGTWTTASATPAGSNTYIQFNDSSVFGGDADLTWDKTGNVMAMGGTAISGFGLSMKKTVTWPSDVSAGHIVLASAANTGRRLVLGVDNGNNYGFLAYGDSGVAWKPLALQPSGGTVTIGQDAINNASATMITTSANLDALYASGSATTRVSTTLRNFDATANARTELNIHNNDGNRPFQMWKYSSNTTTSGSGSTQSADLMRILSYGHISIAPGALGGLAKYFVMPGGTETIRAIAGSVLISDSNGNSGNSDPSYNLHVKGTTTAGIQSTIENTNSGAAAYTAFRLLNSDATSTENFLSLAGGSFTTSGVYQANSVNLSSGKGNLNYITQTAAKPHIFSVGGSATTNEVFRVDNAAAAFFSNANAGANSEQSMYVWNKNASSAAQATVGVANNNSDYFSIIKGSTTFTGSGLTAANGAAWMVNNTSRTVYVNNAAQPFIWATGGSAAANEVARFNTIATGTIEFLGNSNAGLNGEQGLRVYNKNAGSGAFVTSLIINNNGDYFGSGKGSTTFANSGLLNANAVAWTVNHTGQTVYINDASQPHIFSLGGAAAGNEQARISPTGVALSGGATPITSPTARVHIGAGSATASTAPLKMESGTKTTTAEAGTLEYTGTHLETRASAIRYAKGGRLFQSFADVGAPGSAVETDLQSDTLAASTLSVNGDAVRGVYAGIFQGAATVTPRWRIYFGGTVVYDSGSVSLASSVPWKITSDCIRVSASVVRCATSLEQATYLPPQYTEVTGLTLTNTQVYKLSIEDGGASQSANDVVKKLHYVDLQPAL